MNVFKLDLYFLQTGENSTIASIYCNGISDYCDDKQLYLGNHDITHRIKFLWKLLVFPLSVLTFLLCCPFVHFLASQLNRDGGILDVNHHPDFLGKFV